MQIRRAEGIILKTLNFRDYDQILTVFSGDEGVIKLVIKGARRQSRKQNAVPSILARGEFLYSIGKSDLLKCQEWTLLEHNLRLRQNLSHIEAACEMAQAIQQSQLPHKPAPTLYQLMMWYLQKLPQLSDSESLAASFRLKILRHDGLYALPPTCVTCQSPLKAHHQSRGDSFCPQHAPSNTLAFTEYETEVMIILAHCRSFAELESVRISPILKKKLNQLFEETLF